MKKGDLAWFWNLDKCDAVKAEFIREIPKRIIDKVSKNEMGTIINYCFCSTSHPLTGEIS